MTRAHIKPDQATLLILGARRSQMPAILAGLEMGLQIIAIDPDPTAPGLTSATFGYSYDLADQVAILRVARKHAINGIMTMAADYPMPTIARVCEELGLKGPSPEAVAKATNKRLMRIALSSAGVTCPRFIHAEDFGQASRALAELGEDAVFKPAMCHGGRGVTRVPAGSPDEFIERAFRRALDETRADGVLVESLVDGPEFSVETLTNEGVTQVVAVTDKSTSGPPYFVELGHNQPSRWPADQVDLLAHTAKQAVAALGIDDAAGHTEIRLSSQGPFVMEVAARLGGGFINSHLVPLSTGIDLVTATIQVAMGEKPNLQPRSQGRAAAIRFLCAKPGIVTQISGRDSARIDEGVEEVEIYVKPRETVLPLVDASERLGHIICSADDPDQAIALADRIAKQIHIITRSPSEELQEHAAHT